MEALACSYHERARRTVADDAQQLSEVPPIQSSLVLPNSQGACMIRVRVVVRRCSAIIWCTLRTPQTGDTFAFLVWLYTQASHFSVWGIYSALWLSGNVCYIQAGSLQGAQKALDHARNEGYQFTRPQIIDSQEWFALQSAMPPDAILPQQLVSFKGGLFRDDVAFIESVDRSAETAVVWCIPRIDLKFRRSENAQEDAKTRTRPPLAPFAAADVVACFGKEVVKEKAEGVYVFRKQVFAGGLMRRRVRLARLSTRVNYTYSIHLSFCSAPQIPRVVLEDFFWSRYAMELRLGDRVKIVTGQQKRCIGRIVNIEGSACTVQLHDPLVTDTQGLTVVTPSTSLRREFILGDTVIITEGVDSGHWGMVTQVGVDETVTILSPDTFREVSSIECFSTYH